jgi:hypothetical protein
VELMGMYTELVFACELKKCTPKKIISVLEYMTGKNKEEPLILPEHDLFGETRWRFMLQSDSYYFDGDTHSTIRFDKISKSYYLTIRCNVKNYNDEIELFLKWIKPYVEVIEDYPEFKGYYMYEEEEKPNLIYI